LAYLIGLGHAPYALDIDQRLALPRRSIEQVAAALSRLSEVTVTDLAEIVKPFISGVPPDLG